MARLATSDGTQIGRVSAFFDDTYYIELGRAATVADTLELQLRYRFEGGEPEIYETSAPAERRFALVVGPVTRDAAERIRWQLLEQATETTITFGDDLVGRPRPR